MQELFIKRLIMLMEEAHISQVKLAKIIGITNVSISRYLSGNRSPRIEIVVKLAKYFHVSSDFLLGLSNTPYINTAYPPNIIKLVNSIQKENKQKNSNDLSVKQVDMIKKIIDANKDFIFSESEGKKA